MQRFIKTSNANLQSNGVLKIYAARNIKPHAQSSKPTPIFSGPQKLLGSGSISGGARSEVGGEVDPLAPPRGNANDHVTLSRTLNTFHEKIPFS